MRSTRPAEDPSLAVPSQRLAEAQAALDAAVARYAALPKQEKGYGPILDLDYFQAQQHLKRCREQHAESARLLDVAVGMSRTRWLAARAPGLRVLLQAQLAAAEAVQAATRAVRDYMAETAQGIGLAPGACPLGSLVDLGWDLQKLKDLIDPPPVAPNPPPPPGSRRLLVTKKFQDHDKNFLVPPMVVVLPEAEANEALAKGVATEYA
jgi:hypothetical protein